MYDNRGGTGTDTVAVFVQPPNIAPIVVASATPTSGDAPLTVSFSSEGTRDPDGSIASYAWDFGDGGTSSEPNPSHDYTSANNYNATLTVTDNRGGTASKSILIQVTGDCFVNCLRSTDIQLSGQNSGNNARITGKVSVKDENGRGVGQAQVTVQWTNPAWFPSDLHYRGGQPGRRHIHYHRTARHLDAHGAGHFALADGLRSQPQRARAEHHVLEMGTFLVSD